MLDAATACYRMLPHAVAPPYNLLFKNDCVQFSLVKLRILGPLVVSGATLEMRLRWPEPVRNANAVKWAENAVNSIRT